MLEDFNNPYINRERTNVLPLMDFTDDKFMTEMVKTPTRGSNILDLLCCARYSLATIIAVGEPPGTSDHNCICCKMEKVVLWVSAEELLMMS